MSRRKVKLCDRLLAILLSVLMIVAMIPMTTVQVLAASKVDDGYNQSIYVSVQDSSGNPLSGAEVKYKLDTTSEDTSEEWKNTTTNDNGTTGALLEGTETNVLDGTYKLWLNISKDGYESKTTSVELSDEVDSTTETVTLTESVTPQTATVSVNVSGDATVEVNGSKQNTATVQLFTKVPVKITPADGAYIKTLSVDGKAVTVAKGEAYEDIIQANEDISIEATVVKEFTVTAPAVEGGTITLNGKSEESLTVDENTTIKVDVLAAEGYVISNVTIGEKSQTIDNDTSFSEDIEVTANTRIIVAFAKAYTITVNYNENGTVITDPANVGGKVTVVEDSTVKITADPDDNYRVSEVKINNVPVDNLTGENYDTDDTYVVEITADKTYTVDITFALNRYNVTATQCENGSITIGSDLVDHGGNSDIIVTPESGYSVSSVKVNGSDVNTYEEENGTVKFTVTNITEETEIEAAFVLTEKSNIDVKELFNDDVAVRSEGMTFVYKKDGAAIFSTEKNGIILYDINGQVIGGAKDVQSVTIDETTEIAKIELFYQADSEMTVMTHELETVSANSILKIVIDTDPTESTFNPNTANENGYYNTNVTFEVKVEDKGDFSGIALVEYWVTQDSISSESTVLYEYQLGEVLNNIYEDSIVVDASVYNSKDVKVTLHVVDCAGNEETIEKQIMINSTKPTVSLSIDGTQNNNAQEGYYNDERELTITIIDREDTFSQVNAADGLIIYKDGTLVEIGTTDITWQHTVESNQYIGTYKFEDDAHYEWSFSYKNLADVSNEGVTVDENSKDIYEFCIDKAEPYSLALTYNPTFVGVLLETITFGFYQEPVEVIVEAIDDTAGIHQFECFYGDESNVISGTDIQKDGNKAFAKFTIPDDFRGGVSFTATDKAGRTAELTDDKVVIIDTIAPGVTVTWDSVERYNGKFFNTDRTATIEIEEENFFASDVEDELLKITANVVYNDGTSKVEIYKPEFNLENNKYLATITFSEEADYTFDVVYTDRAGNVYDEYPAEEFTIDKTAPIISVEYDNNAAINENQFKHERTATITVVEHNFNKDAMNVVVNGAAIQTEWTTDENVTDTYIAEVSFSGDAHYSFEVNGKDYADNENADVTTVEATKAPWAFTVDKSGPVDLKITYEPTFVATLLESITFGFYKAPVTVKIEAIDDISGIDYFTYSYIVQDEASNINIGKQNVKVDANGENFVKFEIPAQFRGFVSFTATNKAGVSASIADTNAVVVDSIAPGINVVYGNYDALNDVYYKDDRTATITIDEANYFADDIADGLLVITRKAVANDGTIIEETLVPEFTKAGDIYTATIKFDQDADYTFDITYTDRAGNISADYTADEFTVDKIAPVISIEEANGAYFNTDRTAKITVVEHNFRASDFVFVTEAYDVTGNTMIDLSSKDYQNYLKNQDNWSRVEGEADTWETKITFDIEGNYVIDATYMDLAGNNQIAKIEDTFCIDKPDIGKDDPNNLKINYNPTFVGTLLETITFGFYKAPVAVTIEATDDIAGVDYFVYSYAVQDGASDTNIGKVNQTVAATRDGESNRWYATFDISAQFRGNVSFTAYDKATNHASLADENIVVVDNVAPGINVTYSNMSDYDAEFYKADRTATITITEANYFEKDIEEGLLVITVEKILNDGTYTSTKMKPSFTKNGDEYTATIDFTEEAEYTFDIKYTDRAGNVYDSYEKDVFTVDKTAPIINVSYDNNDAKNNDQFKSNRIATITITEHNFHADYVTAKVMTSDSEVTSYAEYLKNDANWTHDGDVHTAVIEYNKEAHYSFELACVDKAGNINADVDYGNSVAPTKFTLDKSAPTGMDIQIANKSVKGSMNTHAFDTFYGDTVTVKLSANGDISGIESLKYQKVLDISDYRIDGTWVDYNAETGIVVKPSEKFVIYFRAEDRAGNVDIIRSTGIVVDNQMPVGEKNAPEIDIISETPNTNGIHKDDVSVSLKVVDPKYAGSTATSTGYYSGLNKITYKIYTNDTNVIEEGTLLDILSKTEGAVYDADNLVNAWSGKITIDAKKFNSNNVIVEVTAVDNAGNERKTTTTAGDIKIDITAPKIVVSYDNNAGDSENFFKADRIANVAIMERNFDANDVVVTITNTDGVVPTISEFVKKSGTGNGDDTTWTATIKYTADGDYTFDIGYTDLAENASAGEVFVDGTVASNAFTIDHTAPVIAVSYDNNDAQNSNYYKAVRTATVEITEHNFNADRVSITHTATDDGVEISHPTISGWSSSGDKHTTTIHYGNDAKYTFDIEMTDKAGNVSADYAEDTFFVDTTMPTLEITGVVDNSANSGDVIPVVSYSDTNFDEETATITLTGANRKEVTLEGGYTDIHNGRTFTFNNFAVEKDVDDIYTLAATITDKAGNTTEEIINFSVNRFGSTYVMSDSAEKLNGTYVKEPIDVVITETNANELTNIKLTLFKNNETIVLKEGSDYEINVVGGNGSWYRYTYTVYAKNFADDGVYRLTFYSEDIAGNIAENTLDTKNTEVSFGVDATKPNIVVANLENNVTYAMENLTVNMSISDNLLLRHITVYLDDYNTPYKTWTAEEIEAIIAENGEFTFDIDGNSTSAHKVKIVCVDAAGNEQVEEITDFFVTTNLWVRYYTNKPLFFGSIAGVILIGGMVVFLVAYKKKKN